MGAEVPVTERARASDRLGELYRRHAADAVRLGYLLTGDRTLAEDLAHEAFVRLYGRFQDLRNPDAFEWYLRRTVLNLVRSHFRHAKVERSYVDRASGEPGRAQPDPAAGSDREAMWQTLLQLPERQRSAIVLRYYEDLSEARTAELLRCPVGTVKSLVSRGLERLRRDIGRGE